MLRRFALSVVLPGVILLAFGLRALDQDRRTTEQQLRERLQRSAELAARTIDQQLASRQAFAADGISLETEPVLKITPPQSVAYWPGPTLPARTAEPILAEAMQAEQVRGDYESAIALYERAAAAGPARVSAAALERLAACYRKTGRQVKSIQAYRALLRFPEQMIGPLPAELIARFELCGLGEGDRQAFYHDLVAGRWRLDKAHYLFYSETAREWAPAADPARAVEREKLALSAAVEEFLETPSRLRNNFVAYWKNGHAQLMGAGVLRCRLEQSATMDQEIRIRLVEAGAPSPTLAAVYSLSDRDLPWIVEASPADASRLFAGADQRRAIYTTILLFFFALLLAGSYFTARAVQRELEVARLKSDFVAMVSHEFRSPLTAIRQLSELLKRGRAPTEEKRQEYYSLISSESGRLSRLVENLLDFSRIEEGRKQYRHERFESAEWLRELVSRFEKQNVSLAIPPDLPPIAGDRMALTSAVDNLLDNAVKYSPPGSPVVCEAESGGGELTICVRDRGCGISREDRAHVFEKFYRGRGEISRQVKGAGVGLSLVRQIVEAHGGKVDFESGPGEGTVFRIRLKTA